MGNRAGGARGGGAGRRIGGGPPVVEDRLTAAMQLASILVLDVGANDPAADDTSERSHSTLQPFASPGALQKSPERVRISEDQVIAALGPGGSINEAMAGYEPRPGQVRMARAVTRSLNDGLRLVIEAGTGTGKSLAYLVPASMFAVANGRRVVISTNTITLQEQLFNKDIPVLRKALPHDVQVAVLKGRTHYLCLRRLRLFLSNGLDGAPERILAARIAIWVRTTETGDRGELAISEAESAIWTNHLSADVMHCTTRLCRDNRSGRCFLARARRRAEGAHLLVVNHALLLTDRAMENPVLPEYDDVILDEAHHLEAVATDQLGTTVSAREIGFELASLSQPQGGTRFGGTVARIAAVFVEAAGEPGREQIASITAPIHEACETARVAVSSLFEVSTDLMD
ncbi:MAG: hypothetical protein EBY11_11015, partial [Proteobacteria bacterium]|nr:hypothetical protein [Pseudomonadota bacterium]